MAMGLVFSIKLMRKTSHKNDNHVGICSIQVVFLHLESLMYLIYRNTMNEYVAITLYAVSFTKRT